jgi:hypothetical protein
MRKIAEGDPNPHTCVANPQKSTISDVRPTHSIEMWVDVRPGDRFSVKPSDGRCRRSPGRKTPIRFPIIALRSHQVRRFNGGVLAGQQGVDVVAQRGGFRVIPVPQGIQVHVGGSTVSMLRRSRPAGNSPSWRQSDLYPIVRVRDGSADR